MSKPLEEYRNSMNATAPLILLVSSEAYETLPIQNDTRRTLDLRGEDVDWDAVFFEIFAAQQIIVW